MSDPGPILQEGMEGELTVEVTSEMTAAHFGNHGVEVLATPYLIGLLETAAQRATDRELAPGQGTVGTHVDVRHLAATPVGMKVTARARLITVEGGRLTFDVEAYDEREQVAAGRHKRFIVDLDRFLERTKQKRASWRTGKGT